MSMMTKNSSAVRKTSATMQRPAASEGATRPTSNRYPEHPAKVSQRINQPKSAKSFEDFDSDFTSDFAQAHLSPNEIDKLPEELQAVLSKRSVRHKVDVVVQALEEFGPSDPDKITVGIYKLTGTIMKRNTLMARIYREVARGTIRQVSRGIYEVK